MFHVYIHQNTADEFIIFRQIGFAGDTETATALARFKEDL